MEHTPAEHMARPPATDAQTAWHDTLCAMSATLQGCLLPSRAAPSREIDRAEAALREYTRRLRHPTPARGTTP